MTNKGVKRYPLSRQVADKLEHMIENGEYPVGERIPTEIELMEMFEVSRNTIREAIQSLTSAGVLVVKQGDGTYVSSSNRFDASMRRKYESVSLQDIREARDTIEVTIARLAAQRRTELDVEEIEAALRRRQHLSEDVKENTRADIEFHMAIAEACSNKIIYDLYRSITGFLESHIAERHLDTELDAEEIDRLHEELFLAIRDQRVDDATICAKNILKI